VKVQVRVPTALRELVGGARSIAVEVDGDESASVAAVLDAVALEHPALERRVRDERGASRIHDNLFVGPDTVTDLDGLATPVAAGQELTIIPAISGG
jgi:molybdopterin converting factor small subunit